MTVNIWEISAAHHGNYSKLDDWYQKYEGSQRNTKKNISIKSSHNLPVVSEPISFI